MTTRPWWIFGSDGYVVPELFEGLCTVLSTTPEQPLGTWTKHPLFEENAQAFLKILPNRQFKYLEITIN